MKTTILSIVLLGLLTAGYAEDDPDNRLMKHLVSVGRFVSNIEGTILLTDDTFSESEEEGWTRHECRIGYRRFSQGGKDTTFVPVLELPALKNDRYVVACRVGVLTVTTAKDERLVVALNLENLAPGLVTHQPRPNKSE